MLNTYPAVSYYFDTVSQPAAVSLPNKLHSHRIRAEYRSAQCRAEPSLLMPSRMLSGSECCRLLSHTYPSPEITGRFDSLFGFRNNMESTTAGGNTRVHVANHCCGANLQDVHSIAWALSMIPCAACDGAQLS